MNEYIFNDLIVGMKVEFEANFSESDIFKFKDLSGDINPIHLDKKIAINAGFKTNFLHGLLTQSLLSRLSGTYLPGRNSIILSVKSDFLRPVYPDDLLKIQGIITKLISSTKLVYIQIKITRNNEKVLRGEMILKMLK